MSGEHQNRFQWLTTGSQAFEHALKVIGAARRYVSLEIYHFDAAGPGGAFLEALVSAAERGLRVRVLVDSFGSITLADSFWRPLRDAGGEVRWFNPLHLHRFAFRNHRKLLVCDGRVGMIGGFNIAPDYVGDGVSRGWRDLGLEIRGPAVDVLVEGFEQTWSIAGFRHRRLPQLRRSRVRASIQRSECELLLSGPGRNSNFILRQLLADLDSASRVDIMVAYFLPPRRLRRAISRVARRGGEVRMVMAGKTDISLSQEAARSYYPAFLRAGVEIWEYQPQILHAKIFVVDDVVYVGSSNLDTRSLQINYELMLRIHDRELAEEGRRIIEGDLRHSVRIKRDEWKLPRNLWAQIRRWWARFILKQVDLFFARRQLKRLR